jgi:hypothetical protein
VLFLVCCLTERMRRNAVRSATSRAGWEGGLSLAPARRRDGCKWSPGLPRRISPTHQYPCQTKRNSSHHQLLPQALLPRMQLKSRTVESSKQESKLMMPSEDKLTTSGIEGAVAPAIPCSVPRTAPDGINLNRPLRLLNRPSASGRSMLRSCLEHSRESRRYR